MGQQSKFKINHFSLMNFEKWGGLSLVCKKVDATVLLCIHSRGVGPVKAVKQSPKLQKNVFTSLLHSHRDLMCMFSGYPYA